MNLREPKPHQQMALDWAKDRDLAGFLIDKRLGKCLVSIRWVLSRGARYILVVAPLSAVGGWIDELEAEGQRHVLVRPPYTSLDAFIDSIQSRVADEIIGQEIDRCCGIGGDPVFFVVNPAALFLARKRTGTRKPMPTDLATLAWDAVLIDESTFIRNPQTQISQVCLEHLTRPSIRAILSGDPAPEGALDLFNQMKFISPVKAFLGERNYYNFREEKFKQVGYEWCPKPGTIAEIRQAVASRCFRMSRKDAGLNEPKTHENRYCELPPRIRKAYDHAEKYFEVPSELEEDSETKYALVVHNWLAQLAGGYPKQLTQYTSDHKLRVLAEMLDGDYRKEPLVVSFRYNLEMAAVGNMLFKRKVRYAVLQGGVALEARMRIQREFKAGNIQVILGQVKAIRYGIDLSAADTMVRFSMSPSYEDVSQSSDRIVHMAKTSVLHYVDIVARDTVDEDRVAAYEDKKIEARLYMSRYMDNFKKRTAKLGRPVLLARKGGAK